jgi:hypothetical protein
MYQLQHLQFRLANISLRRLSHLPPIGYLLMHPCLHVWIFSRFLLPHVLYLGSLAVFPPLVALRRIRFCSSRIGQSWCRASASCSVLDWRHIVIDWSWPVARAATPIHLNQISSDCTGGIAPDNLTSVGKPRINADNNGHFYINTSPGALHNFNIDGSF